jgi:polyisoprenoid-binding protein YceI
VPSWTFDLAHSRVGFSVRHMMFAKVHGRFNAWSGAATAPDAGLDGAQVTAELDVASIDTGHEQRDGHLKSPDFFDVARFPKITFRSTRVEPHALHGDLTIRGVTRPVTLELEDGGTGKDPWGNTRRGFSAKGKLDRAAFGLTWNQAIEAGGVLVGNDVTVELDVQLVRAP